MSPTIIGIIGFVALFAIMFCFPVPVGIGMALVGFAGIIYLVGIDGALSVLGTVPFSTASTYVLTVIPLFILMGLLSSNAGMIKELYNAGYKWLGRFPGGLAMATIAACAGFGAICGSSQAGAVTMGRMSLPEMRRYGYDDSLASATIAAGGTMAILIPPSIGFIIYAMLTDESVGKLFIAGIFPGVLLTIIFITILYILARLNPRAAPRGESFSFREMVWSLSRVWPVLLVFLLVIGGIYMGWFTATESGAIGAFAVLVLTLARRQLNWKGVVEAITTTARITGMFLIILTGAMIFMYFLSITRIPNNLAAFVVGLPVPPVVIFVCVALIIIALGCLMDMLSITIITIPVLAPAMAALGYDLVWFGIVTCLLGEMGLITPPVGQNVFVLSGAFDDLPVWTVYRGVWPFVGGMAICIAIITIFPQIPLFLPNLMIK